MQPPDHLLRQQYHGNVGNNLDATRGEHDLGQVVAFAWNVEFPDCIVRDALHIKENDANNPPDALEAGNDQATPPKGILVLVGRDEDASPV